MLQGEAEQGALLADHTAGSRGYGQGLGRDHLTHDTTTGVGCTGEDRADAQLLGRFGLGAAAKVEQVDDFALLGFELEREEPVRKTPTQPRIGARNGNQ